MKTTGFRTDQMDRKTTGENERIKKCGLPRLTIIISTTELINLRHSENHRGWGRNIV